MSGRVNQCEASVPQHFNVHADFALEEPEPILCLTPHRTSSDLLTCLSGELHEGVYPFFPVAALRGHCGHVVPAQGLDDVHHGLGLEAVRRDHPREEVVAPVIAQLRGSGRVADLRNLQGGTEGG